MTFSVHHSTRKGAKRTNEDRLGYAYTGDSLLMVVADGLGGRPDGEVAAELAVKTAIHEFKHHATPRLSRPDTFLESTLRSAHTWILQYTVERGLVQTPGTTCVACVVQDGKAIWVHSGDSRLYLLRDSRILAKTLDHTQARQLVEQGKISEKQAATHYTRHVIGSYLGIPGWPQIDQSEHPLQAGDTVLLCTDGVWNSLPDADIAAALASSDLSQAVERVIAEAERRAGPNSDNVTAVAVSWAGDEHSADDRSRELVAVMPWVGAADA